MDPDAQPTSLPGGGPPATGKLDEALGRLEALCAGVDRRVEAAGPACARSGRCCDFPRLDHTLFATALEAERVRRRGPPPRPEREGWCPFYRHRLCTVRPLRPLGCRIYFCDPGYRRHRMTAIAEAAHAALRAIHADLDLPYRYAPFLDLLAARDAS